MKRDFAEWLLTFTDSIANYRYYIDFETIYKNAEIYKVELNMLNSLIGSKNIEKEFKNLVEKYPDVIKCIPTLLAVRQSEIIVLDDDGNKFEYSFKEMNYDIEQYIVFMRETGLFELLEKQLFDEDIKEPKFIYAITTQTHPPYKVSDDYQALPLEIPLSIQKMMSTKDLKKVKHILKKCTYKT